MKKPFSPPSWAGPKWRVIQMIVKHFEIKSVSIPNSHISRGFALNLALASFYVWTPKLHYSLHQQVQKRQGWDIVSNLFGIRWVYGPPCLLANNWYTATVSVFFLVYVYTLYIFVLGICIRHLSDLVYGWYTVGIRWYTVVFPFPKHFLPNDCRQKLHI